jgi:hypothetical protein
MITERFLNTYHNASTTPSPDVPADLASFMLAADPVLTPRRSSLGYSLGLIRERPRSGSARGAHARKYQGRRFDPCPAHLNPYY